MMGGGITLRVLLSAPEVMPEVAGLAQGPSTLTEQGCGVIYKRI